MKLLLFNYNFGISCFYLISISKNKIYINLYINKDYNYSLKIKKE